MSKVFAQLTGSIVNGSIFRDATAQKWFAASIVGAFALYEAYPVLYRWELIPFVKTDAYRAREAVMSYSNLDGIVFDAYEKGTDAPRSEMLPTSRGQMIIK